jgi:hypothetical protein
VVVSNLLVFDEVPLGRISALMLVAVKKAVQKPLILTPPTSGPSRDDLLLSLTGRKIIWFRGFDDKNQPHMFKACVIKLGLPIQESGRLVWTLEGIITEKDGGRPVGEFKNCRAFFDTHSRQGTFREEDRVQEYSYEYFQKLSSPEIQKEIDTLKASLPKELRELDEYAATLSPRERLIVEAMHAHKLSNACLGVKIWHELDCELHRTMKAMGY